ncbi:hypothetical protein Taro_055330, partial [Colocasia esculenta]|nr:hypothetical protein [Colocasia esculenta]
LLQHDQEGRGERGWGSHSGGLLELDRWLAPANALSRRGEGEQQLQRRGRPPVPQVVLNEAGPQMPEDPDPLAALPLGTRPRRLPLCQARERLTFVQCGLPVYIRFAQICFWILLSLCFFFLQRFMCYLENLLCVLFIVWSNRLFFDVWFIYYGVQLNVENLNFNLYLSMAVNRLMEIPAVILGSVLLSFMGHRTLFSSSAALAGAACLLCIPFAGRRKGSKGSYWQRRWWGSWRRPRPSTCYTCTAWS